MENLRELYTESSTANYIHLNLVKVFSRVGTLLVSGFCEVTERNTFIIHTKYALKELELSEIKKVVDTGKSTYIMMK